MLWESTSTGLESEMLAISRSESAAAPTDLPDLITFWMRTKSAAEALELAEAIKAL